MVLLDTPVSAYNSLYVKSTRNIYHIHLGKNTEMKYSQQCDMFSTSNYSYSNINDMGYSFYVSLLIYTAKLFILLF